MPFSVNSLNLKMTSKQPDMSLSCVCSGQNQILPQKIANKKAIRQNNGVVTKWPFNLNTTSVRTQHCSTKGVCTLMHSNNNVTHRIYTHTGPRATHRLHISLVSMNVL